MQYYFARTGLLDGKGAQLAKEDKDNKKMVSGKENLEPSVAGSGDDLAVSSMSLYDGISSYAMSDPGADSNVVESPTDIHSGADSWLHTAEPPMLPPTVSTYKQKPSYTEPLPDTPVLRRELKEALQDVCKVLEESHKPPPDTSEEQTRNGEKTTNDGFYEIQGLHFLDIITLAIRAAKNYYTTHPSPAKLYAIKSEKRIRSDLYQVLDILKRMASRNFRGGIRLPELGGIVAWIESIDSLLKKEEAQEQQEAAEREGWMWREGDWSGKEKEREWLFLRSFDQDMQSPLPTWPEGEEGQVNDDQQTNEYHPPPFLQALQDGTRLITLHNTLVFRSHRKFGEIKTWHTNTSKPYRKAENLRFWLKAAELRWELKLPAVPVSDIVNGKQDAEVWRVFGQAVLEWCRGVREELSAEWREEEERKGRGSPRKGTLPELRVEVPPVEDTGVSEDADCKAGTVEM